MVGRREGAGREGRGFLEQVWSDFCNIMERRVGAENMEIWVWSGSLRLGSVAGGDVEVRADSKYAYDWIKDNLLEDVEASFRRRSGDPCGWTSRTTARPRRAPTRASPAAETPPGARPAPPANSIAP